MSQVAFDDILQTSVIIKDTFVMAANEKEIKGLFDYYVTYLSLVPWRSCVDLHLELQVGPFYVMYFAYSEYLPHLTNTINATTVFSSCSYFLSLSLSLFISVE